MAISTEVSISEELIRALYTLEKTRNPDAAVITLIAELVCNNDDVRRSIERGGITIQEIYQAVLFYNIASKTVSREAFKEHANILILEGKLLIEILSREKRQVGGGKRGPTRKKPRGREQKNSKFGKKEMRKGNQARKERGSYRTRRARQEVSRKAKLNKETTSFPPFYQYPDDYYTDYTSGIDVWPVMRAGRDSLKIIFIKVILFILSNMTQDHHERLLDGLLGVFPGAAASEIDPSVPMVDLRTYEGIPTGTDMALSNTKSTLYTAVGELIEQGNRVDEEVRIRMAKQISRSREDIQRLVRYENRVVYKVKNNMDGLTKELKKIEEGASVFSYAEDMGSLTRLVFEGRMEEEIKIEGRSEISTLRECLDMAFEPLDQYGNPIGVRDTVEGGIDPVMKYIEEKGMDIVREASTKSTTGGVGHGRQTFLRLRLILKTAVGNMYNILDKLGLSEMQRTSIGMTTEDNANVPFKEFYKNKLALRTTRGGTAPMTTMIGVSNFFSEIYSELRDIYKGKMETLDKQIGTCEMVAAFSRTAQDVRSKQGAMKTIAAASGISSTSRDLVPVTEIDSGLTRTNSAIAYISTAEFLAAVCDATDVAISSDSAKAKIFEEVLLRTDVATRLVPAVISSAVDVTEGVIKNIILRHGELTTGIKYENPDITFKVKDFITETTLLSPLEKYGKDSLIYRTVKAFADDLKEQFLPWEKRSSHEASDTSLDIPSSEDLDSSMLKLFRRYFRNPVDKVNPRNPGVDRARFVNVGEDIGRRLIELYENDETGGVWGKPVPIMPSLGAPLKMKAMSEAKSRFNIMIEKMDGIISSSNERKSDTFNNLSEGFKRSARNVYYGSGYIFENFKLFGDRVFQILIVAGVVVVLVAREAIYAAASIAVEACRSYLCCSMCGCCSRRRGATIVEDGEAPAPAPAAADGAAAAPAPADEAAIGDGAAAVPAPGGVPAIRDEAAPAAADGAVAAIGDGAAPAPAAADEAVAAIGDGVAAAIGDGVAAAIGDGVAAAPAAADEAVAAIGDGAAPAAADEAVAAEALLELGRSTGRKKRRTRKIKEKRRVLGKKSTKKRRIRRRGNRRR